MLALSPTQPAEAVPVYALFARIEDLPYYLAALARAAVNRPGVTADHLLTLADHCGQVARECRLRDVRGMLEPEATAWDSLAAILRDCAPHHPHPPRLPVSAIEADAAMHRRAAAAGIATAHDGGAP